jgi:hypothetical protein
VTVEKFTVKVNESLSLESQSEIRNFGNGSYLQVEKFNDPEISYKMSISLKQEEAISFRPRRLSFFEKSKLREFLD